MKILIFYICILFASPIWTLDKKKDCQCKTFSEKRIVGGKIAHPLSYPFMLTVAVKETTKIPDSMRKQMPIRYKVQMRHNCGCSIVNERYVLTAGHCILNDKNSKMSDNFHIGYGSNDLVQIFDGKKYIEIEEAIRHPKYNTDYAKPSYDIALIKLKEPLSFGPKIRPACLSKENITKYQDPFKIVGWGSVNQVIYNYTDSRNNKNPVVSRFLKEGIAFDRSDSLKKLCLIRKNSWENICTDNEKTNETACKGDSGGPLLYDFGSKTKVVGIASFVDVEAFPKFGGAKLCFGPTAWTRLSAFMDFVEEHVQNDYCD